MNILNRVFWSFSAFAFTGAGDHLLELSADKWLLHILFFVWKHFT